MNLTKRFEILESRYYGKALIEKSVELAEEFANEQLAKINYTRCCEEFGCGNCGSKDIDKEESFCNNCSEYQDY